MNPTSRAIFQSVISSDPSLTGPERTALERLLRGETGVSALGTGPDSERLLLSQKKAAKLLDANWRGKAKSLLTKARLRSRQGIFVAPSPSRGGQPRFL